MIEVNRHFLSSRQGCRIKLQINSNQRSFDGHRLQECRVGEPQSQKLVVSRRIRAGDHGLWAMLNEGPQTRQQSRPLGLAMLRKQVGRLRKRIRRDKYLTGTLDHSDKEIVVLGRELSGPAMLVDQNPSSQPNHQQEQEVGIDVDAAMHDLSGARNLTVPDGLNGTVSVADANHLVRPAW